MFRTTRGLRAVLAGAALLTAAGTTALVAAPSANAAGLNPTTMSATGKIIAKTGLNVRSAPSSHDRVVGSFAKGAVISIDCKLNGTNVHGNDRWYKVHGRDAYVTARYVANIGAAPVTCTGGDWAYKATARLTVRQGPSTKDAAIGHLRKGKRFDTRWIVSRGQKVKGNPNWLSVWTSSGNRGWVSAAYVHSIGGR